MINVTGNWDSDRDYTTFYAKTDDPRVLAVVQADEEVTFEWCLEGDAITPTYMIDRWSGKVRHIGGYDDGETRELADRLEEAQDHFIYAAGYRRNGLSSGQMAKADDMLARWAWVFYGATVNRGRYGYGADYDIAVLNTPSFREHVGLGEQTREDAQATVDNMTTELSAIADGNVYGIGWATCEDRVMDDDQPIDLEEWDVQIECWGFIGEDYAKDSAARWDAGTPDLPSMLPLP